MDTLLDYLNMHDKFALNSCSRPFLMKLKKGCIISLIATPDKLLDLLNVLCTNKAEEESFGYLKLLIGNMGSDDLRNFLRFATLSTVCIAKKIQLILVWLLVWPGRKQSHVRLRV